MAGFTLFLSSTVIDFADVRKQLGSKLQKRAISIRMSEDKGFPVKPGVDPHDACLDAVKKAHAYVLLVGQRFGSRYHGGLKSITWREWETARAQGLPPIILIHRDAAKKARSFIERVKTEMAKSSVSRDEAFERVGGKGEFRNKGGVQDFPCVVRFIEAIRKDSKDNWYHEEWDGSSSSALGIIEERLGSMFVAYQEAHLASVKVAQRHKLALDALATFSQAAELKSAYLSKRRTLKPSDVDAAVATLLSVVASWRSDLFGFEPGDRHNLSLHRLERGRMVRVAREAHPEVPDFSRTWILKGAAAKRSHVAITVQSGRVQVAPDLSQTEAWDPDPRTETEDRKNYASIVSVPVYHRGDAERPDGALTLTSSRLNHFSDPDQPEVLTFKAVSRMVSSVWARRRV